MICAKNNKTKFNIFILHIFDFKLYFLVLEARVTYIYRCEQNATLEMYTIFHIPRSALPQRRAFHVCNALRAFKYIINIYYNSTIIIEQSCFIHSAPYTCRLIKCILCYTRWLVELLNIMFVVDKLDNCISLSRSRPF